MIVDRKIGRKGVRGMKGKKILVADDEPHILRSLKLVLEEAGYSVLTATNGEEAFHKTKKEKPDLLILDIKMQKMNGYEVCDKLRTDPLQRDMPVMILSALGQTDQNREGSEDHAFAIIAKPFSPYSLLDQVRKILKN
jgi:two-component system alkaline phosphatase synthesis response regulator PhoP